MPSFEYTYPATTLLKTAYHSPDLPEQLNQAQLKFFNQNGYLIIPSWLKPTQLKHFQRIAQAALTKAEPPLELEAELGYPGSPSSEDAQGGLTPRRLLGAYQREPDWQGFATQKVLARYLSQLLAHPQIYLSQSHHNCLMTKSPRYSSDTGWHQDYRYWQFEQAELVTAWLALGNEAKRNGGLRVIPGSHTLAFEHEQFDENLFFKEDQPNNQALIKYAKTVELAAGDLLFFHCNTLHCASRNLGEKNKLSLVFTYRNGSNAAIKNTRSASQKDICITE